jgi:glutathionylspermidine synthase
MQRIRTSPRANWQTTVESQGFHFHSMDETPYWDESVYYHFTAEQIDQIEAATYDLEEMCLHAAQHVIDQRLYDRFQIPQAFVELIQRSWERDERSLYGRFDLAYDGFSPPKLLEYNADTPTSLLEAAVIQWYWLKDVAPAADQFNSIHDRLIEAWREMQPQLMDGIHFTSINGNLEDFITVTYLRDTAMQAGLSTEHLETERIGWNRDRNCFVDETEHHIANCFKLYPWEWMIRERFGDHLLHDNTRWLEPPWKMLLSNKAILPVLHELFPDSPHILAASFEPEFDRYVRKPILSREGANIEVVDNGKVVQKTDGPYTGPHVYQEYCPLAQFDGHRPLVGSWMVNGWACGIGIREDDSLITGNTSRFVPHIFSH